MKQLELNFREIKEFKYISNGGMCETHCPYNNGTKIGSGYCTGDCDCNISTDKKNKIVICGYERCSWNYLIIN